MTRRVRINDEGGGDTYSSSNAKYNGKPPLGWGGIYFSVPWEPQTAPGLDSG